MSNDPEATEIPNVPDEKQDHPFAMLTPLMLKYLTPSGPQLKLESNFNYIVAKVILTP
jgi:hypothetical protein